MSQCGTFGTASRHGKLPEHGLDGAWSAGGTPYDLNVLRRRRQPGGRGLKNLHILVLGCVLIATEDAASLPVLLMGRDDDLALRARLFSPPYWHCVASPTQMPRTRCRASFGHSIGAVPATADHSRSVLRGAAPRSLSLLDGRDV